MELLVNDLSLNGQFSDISAFKEAIERIMRMRNIARQFGRQLHCHRNVAHSQVTQLLSMQQVIGSLNREQQRDVMQWLTKNGPFWEDDRNHRPDDYLECNGEIVTDTALGEAAYSCFHGINRHLVSFTPSTWEFTPIPVIWKSDDNSNRNLEVSNYWSIEELEAALRTAPEVIKSWEELARISMVRYTQLTFSVDSFEHLQGHPFARGAAERILILLDVLNKLKGCLNNHGQRTPEGNQLYQDHFTGDKAWFSDSSESEKHDFKIGLTFSHPVVNGESLFCTWHGKVKTPQIRIHFSWPIRIDAPLYIVYVGPKITKR